MEDQILNATVPAPEQCNTASAQAMPDRISRGNANRSAVRSAVDLVFTGKKDRKALVIRTRGMPNLAHKLQRLACPSDVLHPHGTQRDHRDHS